MNVSSNMARAGRRYQTAMSRLPPPPAVPDFAEEVAGRLDDTAQLQEAGRALAALRPGEREVIALCVWSGLDYATAARALGVPVATARSRLSRARRNFRCWCPRAGTAGGREQVTGDRENAARPTSEGT